MVKASFTLEAAGVYVSEDAPESKADDRALSILESTTKYLKEEKRWETGLLWSYDRTELPSSKDMAMRRLLFLESRMAKNKELRECVNSKINRYKQLRYVRKLKNGHGICRYL